MPTETVAIYLRDVREGRGFTQESLAEAVGVGKRTIERLERNEGDISIAPFERIVAILKASPEDVNYLATNPSATVDEARELARVLLAHDPLHRWTAATAYPRAYTTSMIGVQIYIRVLRERQHLSRKALADAVGVRIADLADWEANRTSVMPFPLLVRVIAHLGGTLDDLHQIGMAVAGHEALGRRLAEERFRIIQARHQTTTDLVAPRLTPAIERTMLRRLVALEGLIHYLLNLLKRALPGEADDIDRTSALWFQTISADDDRFRAPLDDRA